MNSALSDLGRRTSEPPISWLMRMTLDHPNLVSLAAGFTDSASLPARDARELLADLLRSPIDRRGALQYGTTAGDPELRRLSAERVQRLDALACGRDRLWGCSPDRVLITHGSQQLLYMATEALCGPGDIVLVEDPTYFVYLGIVQSHGLVARGVRLTKQGIDVLHLEQILQSLKRTGQIGRVKLLYCVTYHQNPTGTTTSAEVKAAALDLLRRYERAAGHPLYLLEDAAYRELRFSGSDIPSALIHQRAADRVVYSGTYSKPFATGARVGFGLLPEPILTAVRRIKGNHDFGTANLLQQLLAGALASGRFDKHVRQLRKRYSKKAGIMCEALRAHFPDEVTWEQPGGGLYVWARLPDRLKSGVKSRLFRRALAHEVLYVPGQLCYADDPARPKPNSEMRLSFGGATEKEIQQGIRRLGEALGELLE